MTLSVRPHEISVSRELAPHLRDWDRAQQLPREVIRKMGAEGLLGGCIPSVVTVG